MPRRTIVKVFPQYDDKPTFVESPIQKNPHRSSTGTSHSTLNDLDDHPGTEAWTSGPNSYRYPVPQNGDPWETCIEKVRAYDGEMCDGWREEVDNLLIFAGLFSAAVTAFVIESYQALSQDPVELNNHLLKQLIIETHNANTQDPAARNSTLPPFPVFSPSGTDIRVNVFWFMSLALSLATVLIGILCTQWIREYERDPPLDPKEALSLRQIRHEGLIAWKVPKILSMLPVILHTSLVLFFAGLIDLLWNLNLTVAIFVSIISGALLFFVVATTVLPTLQMLFVKDMRLQTPQCAYKSPQAWTVHRIVTFFIRFILPESPGLGNMPFSYFNRYNPFFHDKDWVDFDVRWKSAREKTPKLSNANNVKSDLVQGLVWIDKNLGQNTEMIHTMYHCLRDLKFEDAFQILVQLDDKVKTYLVDRPGPSITARASHCEWPGRDTLSALFLELNNRAFPQLEQFQLELIIRSINSRLEYRSKHPKQAQEINISDCFPFIHWPLFNVRQIPGALFTQFLLCIKTLVSERQTNTDADEHIWELIDQIMSSHPSIEDNDFFHHDTYIQLAFEIMLAYENALSKTDGIEGIEGDESERQKFTEKVRACVKHIIKAFPAGELQRLSPEPRKRASNVIMALQKRVNSMPGGVDKLLQTPDERNRWLRISTVAHGGSISTLSSTDYRSDSWDIRSSPL